MQYLAEQGGEELAERFVNAAQQTFEALAAMPKVGVRCEFSRPVLRRVRRWPVKGFENWLIFYLPKKDGVEIVHVIHGASDINSLLNR
jgi:toxin ParE1/3/4